MFSPRLPGRWRNQIETCRPETMSRDGLSAQTAVKIRAGGLDVDARLFDLCSRSERRSVGNRNLDIFGSST